MSPSLEHGTNRRHVVREALLESLSVTFAVSSLGCLISRHRALSQRSTSRVKLLAHVASFSGAMRRLLFLPIKRWQAAVTEANAEDPQSLLMAGLSPAPGKEGYHRLRGGAAGRRRGAPPLSALGKDAGKSWEQLSSFFG